jgi:hypothetical protein
VGFGFESFWCLVGFSWVGSFWFGLFGGPFCACFSCILPMCLEMPFAFNKISL